jgi:CTP synthase
MGKDCLCVHLTYVPFIAAAKEYKTKPTQHSLKQLLELGVQPDILVLRTEQELSTDILHKVALFCNVSKEAVIQSIDVPAIYEVPLMLHRQKMDAILLEKMGVTAGSTSEMKQWKDFLKHKNDAVKEVKIGLVGKYIELQDAYKSIEESLLIASIYNDRKLALHFINSVSLNEMNVEETLKEMDGVVIAPGFGQRGLEGKFVALKYAREHDMPCFGICLGMQCMVIEYARNVLGLEGANSTENEASAKHNVIDIMEEQKNITNLGGSMRLGAYECTLKKDSKVFEIYKTPVIQERHRHRYEFNNEYKQQFEEAGMYCVGENPDTNLIEIVEVPSLKWYIGVQYHPEYNCTVVKPHPLFVSFIKAATESITNYELRITK